MKSTAIAILLFVLWSTPATATASRRPTVTPDQREDLLAGVDDLCRCTHLQRKSGLVSAEHYYDERGAEGFTVTVFLSADGTTALYEVGFYSNPRYPMTVREKDYESHVAQGSSADTNASDRKFCLGIIQRLDNCKVSWAHYGAPRILKDGSRGFRITFLSCSEEEIAREERGGGLVMDPYINISVTRKGTIYGITSGA